MGTEQSSQMVLGKLDVHTQMNEVGPALYTIHRNQLSPFTEEETEIQGGQPLQWTEYLCSPTNQMLKS